VASPLTAARATPFWLPASHFAAGLVFLSALALLLPFIASDLAQNRFLQPRVVAATHLITLGWLTLSIMGALCQLFTVVLGTPLRWVRLAAVTLALYSPGLAVFVTGLLLGQLLLMVAGAVLFSFALVLFLVNAIATLVRAKTRDLTWWSLAGAFFFLASTITFGISLAVNLESNHLGLGRIGALFIHVHVALGGWVLLTIIGVARRLLPMFLLSHGSGEGALHWAAWLTGGGALLLTLFHRALTPTVANIAIALLVAGVCALIVQIATYVRTRHRPQLDAGLRLVLSGVALWLLGVGIGLTGRFIGGTALVAAYGVAVVGGLTLFVAGHYYKILPFLLWNHRFAPFAGKRTLPKINELYGPRLANAAAAASAIGMVTLLLGALLRFAPLAVIGATAVSSGFLIEVAQLITLLRARVN
jgi:hypothetical protein